MRLTVIALSLWFQSTLNYLGLFVVTLFHFATFDALG